jgi:hypothetical protein
MEPAAMHFNADFSRQAAVHSAEQPWVPSPMPGVSRRMLDRIGDEVARATSIVRYDPQSHFSPHTHTGGEEFVVLEGVFQDEHGDYPTGTYVRNPPTTQHTPGSAPGCTLFVKLWQFDPDDRHQMSLMMHKGAPQAPADRPGVTIYPLYEDARETVCMENWAALQSSEIVAEGGIELLVLEGELVLGEEVFRRHAWLRVPIGERVQATAGSVGARLWLKTGHLRFATDNLPV